MGILEAAKPAVVICTRNRDRATVFYRDKLGLAMVKRTISRLSSTSEELRCVSRLWLISCRMSTPSSDSACRMCRQPEPCEKPV
jgi:hypothetical protein